MAIAYLYKYALTSGVVAVDTSSFKQAHCGDGYLFGPWTKGGLDQVMKEGRDFSYSMMKPRKSLTKWLNVKRIV